MPIQMNNGENAEIGQLLALLGGGASGFFPKAGQSTSGTQNQDTTNILNQNQNTTSELESLLKTLSHLRSSTSQTTSQTPTLGGPQQQLLDQITQKYKGMQNVNLAPYAAQQTQQINKNSDLQSQAVNNVMAVRGLSTSPVAGTAEANIQNNRIGQISQFQSTLPLLQDQLDLSHLTSAGGFLSSIPRATTGTSVGTGTQTGSTDQSGHNFQTGSQNIGQIAQGAISGGSQQTTKPTGSGGIGGVIQGLVPILLSLFG